MSFSKSSKTLCALGGALMLAAVLPTGSVMAQTLMCTDRTALLKELNGKYHEQRQGLGIAAGNRGAMEFYASKTGTWTIVMTMTNGNACIVAAGHSWQTMPVLAQGPEA